METSVPKRLFIDAMINILRFGTCLVIISNNCSGWSEKTNSGSWSDSEGVSSINNFVMDPRVLGRNCWSASVNCFKSRLRCFRSWFMSCLPFSPVSDSSSLSKTISKKCNERILCANGVRFRNCEQTGCIDPDKWMFRQRNGLVWRRDWKRLHVLGRLFINN